MATDVVAADGLRPGRKPGRRRLPLAWLVVVPFFAYALIFLFLPSGQVLVGAFKGEHGSATFSNLSDIIHSGNLRHYFRTSIEVSLVTAGLGAVFGLLIAYAAIREGTPRWIRSAFTTFSGVAANFGGIPLAFAFISTIGTIGIVTKFLQGAPFHYNLYQHGFTLFSKTGVEIVYLYFQIPLMILIIAPAIDGLRREWREASSNLGASAFQYWRYVGLPVLLPSILSTFILLFGNAFAAYATAYGLTTGGVPLVPIQIGFDISGNVVSNPHEAQALAFGMFVVLALMMVIYVPLQRRSSRWAK